MQNRIYVGSTTTHAYIQSPSNPLEISTILVKSCRNVPFCGRAKARLTGALSKGGKMRGVTTNIYLWETSEKPKETGRNENSKFGSCIYV